MLLKFFIFKEKDFVKQHFYYYLLFFIIEIILGVCLYFTNASHDIFAFIFGYLKNDTNILLIFINKLFVLLFILFITLKNMDYYLQFSQSCFVGRMSRGKLYFNCWLFNFWQLIIIYSCLFVLSSFICFILSVSIKYNLELLFQVFLFQFILSSLSCASLKQKKIYIIIPFIILFLLFLYDYYLSFIVLIFLNIIILLLYIYHLDI